MSTVELSPAYVLHRRAFSESSLLLEVLTPGHGRLGLVARGVLRGKARNAGLLQPFQPLQIGWAGRGSLPALARFEPVGGAPAFDGDGLFAGFYLNELVMRLTARDDPNPILFAAYQSALPALASGPLEPALRQFEVAALDACGFGLVLTEDAASGQPIDPDSSYHYAIDRGAVLNVEEAGPHALVVPGRVLLALAGEHDWDHAALQAAKRLMRSVVRHYAGDRPFESRRLFAQRLK